MPVENDDAGDGSVEHDPGLGKNKEDNVEGTTTGGKLVYFEFCQ